MTSVARLALTAMAVVATAHVTSAQAPSDVFNTPDVQKLVSAGTPERNIQLAGHFAAMSNAYLADAARHNEMAKAYAANPAAGVATALARRAARLGEIAAAAATAAHEMARYHERLAGVAAPAAAAGTAGIHLVTATSQPTASPIDHLALSARTPADHHALEAYFAALAKTATADADTHVRMSVAYRSGVRTAKKDPGLQCELLAKLAREAAQEAKAAALLHRQLAQVG
jgi:hypothetical protein